MNPIKMLLIDLSNHEYYIKHLQILNPVLPVQLTNTEIEVLAGFMSLKGDIVDNDRFGTQSRKIVKQRLGGMSSGGLGNHLKELINKAFIFKNDDGKYEIKPFLIPEKNNQVYQFKIVNDGKS